MKKTEEFLRAVADDKRPRILKMLEKKGMSVCEMTAVLGIRQPIVSRHIKILKEVGLIDQKQIGRSNLSVFLLRNFPCGTQNCNGSILKRYRFQEESQLRL